MKTWRGILLAVVITASWASSARGMWGTYTEADGLLTDAVLSITEDHSGNLWFGTALGGVSRYDGVGWRTWAVFQQYYDVTDILEDRSGNLWFGSSGGGVSRYDGVSWQAFARSDGLADSCVYSIFEDHSGILWFGTGRGLSRYDGTSWQTFTTYDGLPGNVVMDIAEDGSGNLCCAVWGGGVSWYDGVSRFTDMGLPNNLVVALVRDRSGNLWCGTYGGGVICCDGEWSCKAFRTQDGLADNLVDSILEDRSGNLWFGTCGGGVSQYDGESWRTFTRDDGLANPYVLSILEDHSGNVWFGTYGGVSRYDGANWRTFAILWVNSILEDRSGSLWFGTDDGVSWYDGEDWRTFTKADGLADDWVTSILEDRLGNLWFGTYGGVSRYDGASWRTFTTDDGLADGLVRSIAEDRSGNLWFGTRGGGVSWYDGENWRTFTKADGLADDWVTSILEDRSGNLWFGTDAGVSRYDGENWRTFTTDGGLAGNWVSSIAEDRSGNLWFGTTCGGVSRFDGVSWHTLTTSDGLAGNCVYSILEDRSGSLWFGTQAGVSRYDGVIWGTLTPADGLVHASVGSICEDHLSNLWLGTHSGVTLYEPDRVPPRAVLPSRPLRLSASTTQAITFSVAFGEVWGIAFSYSLNGSPWSEWSQTNIWMGTNLPDGEHVFKLRARDRIGNVDPTPAGCTFEIDATPPTPVIVSPAYGQPVRDSVSVIGSAVDLRFRNYRVEWRPLGTDSWELLAESSSPVEVGVLCGWNTTDASDGNYELRLSVADTLGLSGTALIEVIIDNHAPWAHETAPAMISVTSGGDVYTTNEEVHLYFPPRAFARETEVRITTPAESELPDTLDDGAVRVLSGYEISWGGAVLEKPATLEMSYAATGGRAAGSGVGVLSAGLGSSPSVDSMVESQIDAGALALYVFGADSTWRRVGGTADAPAERISASITEPGRYALFEGPGVVPVAGALSELVVTPRAFSPRGNFASGEAAISFTLGRSGPVMVKIYNRAGRLVREVASVSQMNAGANLVRWDGRDSQANQVEDGLYLVVVEALGKKQTKTLAVVR